MPKPSAKLRLVAMIVLVFALGAGGALARWTLLPWALGAALKSGGATDVTFAVQRATPWNLRVTNLGFKLDALHVSAGSATLDRSHWWSRSLGRLQVADARVVADLDRLPAGQVSPAATPAAAAPPAAIPLEEISIEGRVTLLAGGVSDQGLVVNFSARPVGDTLWRGEARATAPGLELGVAATYDFRTQALGFKSTALRLDLQPWQAWLEHWAPLPHGPWELAGTISGEVSGSFESGRLAAAGTFEFHADRVANTEMNLMAESVDVRAELADLRGLRAPKVTLHAASVTNGKLAATDLAAEFSMTGTEQLKIASISARSFGGRVSAEPFVFRPADPALDLVVVADGIQAEEVLTLAPAVPAQASGPLSGRVPVHYEGGKLRFGTGWLGLREGMRAMVQFQASGLLTSGMSQKNYAYPVLKQVEDGILNLKVSELRLDIRPPDLPPGQSARLHIVGDPADPKVKVPVTVDVNVNGPFEQLLDLGLKTSGASLGTKP